MKMHDKERHTCMGPFRSFAVSLKQQASKHAQREEVVSGRHGSSSHLSTETDYLADNVMSLTPSHAGLANSTKLGDSNPKQTYGKVM